MNRSVYKNVRGAFISQPFQCIPWPFLLCPTRFQLSVQENRRDETLYHPYLELNLVHINSEVRQSPLVQCSSLLDNIHKMAVINLQA